MWCKISSYHQNKKPLIALNYLRTNCHRTEKGLEKEKCEAKAEEMTQGKNSTRDLSPEYYNWIVFLLFLFVFSENIFNLMVFPWCAQCVLQFCIALTIFERHNDVFSGDFVAWIQFPCVLCVSFMWMLFYAAFRTAFI